MAYSALNLLFGWILLLMRDRVFFPGFENGALIYLGKISYGLYVYHFVVIWLMSQTARALFPGSPGIRRLMVIVGSLGVTIAISLVSYAIIEAPLGRFARSESERAVSHGTQAQRPGGGCSGGPAPQRQANPNRTHGAAKCRTRTVC